MLGPIFGFLLAVYFLVGRWSFERLDGTDQGESLLSQPRFWIVAMLIPVVVLLREQAPRHATRRSPTSVDLATLIFLAYMMVTAIWAPSAELAFDKCYELGLMFVVAIAIGSARVARVDDRIQDGFWWTIVLFGMVMAGLAIFYSAGGRIHVPGGGPNTFGRNMGLMAIGAVYLAGKYGMHAKPLAVAAIVVAALMILLCGSRGALLASSVGGLVLLATGRGPKSKRLAAAGGVALLAVTALWSTSAGKEALDTFQERIVHQTFENRHLSDRDDLWLDAVDWIQERPWFGWGLNGYRANSWNYPHNIFLEVTVEGGVLGLLLLLNLGRGWWVLARHHRFDVPRVALSALGLVLTAAQTSGDLFDSRGVFLLLTLATPLASPAARHLGQDPRLVRRSISATAAPAGLPGRGNSAAARAN